MDRSEALWQVGDVWSGVVTRLLRDHARGDDILTPEHRALLRDPPPWLRRNLREIGAAGGFLGGMPITALAALYGDVAAFRASRAESLTDDAELSGLRSLLGSRPEDPLARRQWESLAHRATAVARHQPRQHTRMR
jgi:hypothetical protein